MIMKTDWRIMGEPYRGSRRIVCLKCGFSTKEDAENYKTIAIVKEELSSDSYVRAQRVRDNFNAEEAEKHRTFLM